MSPQRVRTPRRVSIVTLSGWEDPSLTLPFPIPIPIPILNTPGGNRLIQIPAHREHGALEALCRLDQGTYIPKLERYREVVSQ
ncbi:uncharacterized protein DNG_03773 [Cephalotrichum gorgonifer]|uniref:Uncharacterized protein n=1 Tax=Cephalotrichum gorgonifer TaxID=2041049 RepID=A0AAE8MUS3_9PEZI|nr:uncharacterized protein DNG_03773 [Cephalotrichum gorgonifer]